MVLLSDKLIFPNPEESEADGLIALGGDLSPKRLLLAYKKGIFPWETEPVIGWYSPDPRCILIPSSVKVSKSMKPLLASNKFKFTINKSFPEVIHFCQQSERKGTQGSWISDELISSFLKLHQGGFGFSAETWYDGELVGGLYGLIIGKVFFGESMFSRMPNASKYALIKFCKYLHKKGIELIDCQVYSEHLESMGAVLVSRHEFLQALKVMTQN